MYGTFLGLGSALAAEACALAGFDWLLTDLEHGGGDESELLAAAGSHRLEKMAATHPADMSGSTRPCRAKDRLGAHSSGSLRGGTEDRVWGVLAAAAILKRLFVPERGAP